MSPDLNAGQPAIAMRHCCSRTLHVQNMMKNVIRFVVSICFAIGLGVAPSAASAQACSDPATASYNGPTLTIDPTVAVGATLAQFSLSGTFTTGSTCTPTTAYTTWSFQGTGTYEGNNLYDTEIPGIGMQMSAGIVGPLPGSVGVGGGVFWPAFQGGLLSAGTSVNSAVGVSIIRLVKTGPITTGGQIAGNFATMTLSDNGGPFSLWLTYTFASPIVVQVVPPTCSVVSRQISVTLPTVSMGSFKGVGATSGATPFNITLFCSRGGTLWSPGAPLGIYTTLTGPTDNPTTLSLLSSSSAATGVGIEVLNGTTPVNFGADSNVIGNPGQFQAGQFPGTSLGKYISIPLTARYIRTSTTVTPGSANAIATFTMGYQ